MYFLFLSYVVQCHLNVFLISMIDTYSRRGPRSVESTCTGANHPLNIKAFSSRGRLPSKSMRFWVIRYVYPKQHRPNTNTMYHMHTFSDSKCMHVVHSVGFRSVLVLGIHTLDPP